MSYRIPERLHGVREEDFAAGVVETVCGRTFPMAKVSVDLSGRRVFVRHRTPRDGDPVPHVCHTCDRIEPLFGGSE